MIEETAVVRTGLPFAMLSPGMSIVIENVGASGWVVTVKDRHGQAAFLAQDDDPDRALEKLSVEIGKHMARVFEEGMTQIRQGLETSGDALKKAAEAITGLAQTRN